jgi:hypothetical protein
MKSYPAIAVGLVMMSAAAAYGQTSPNFSYGQVPTPAQWNSTFSGKQDILGFTPLNRAGDSMTGLLRTAPGI